MGAIIVVLLLAATMLVGAAAFSYTAHCFLTVVGETASGNDKIAWPKDSFFDWIWEAVYMFWLTGVWLAPVALVMRTMAGTSFVVLIAAALIWLLFPLTLLSSLSASSRWILISPRLLSRLFGQRFGSLLQFYLHSAPVLAVGGVAFYLQFFAPGGAMFALVTAPALATALFIYARQIGRLAHLVEHTDGPATPRPTQEPRRRRVRPAAYDPWSEAGNQPVQPRDLPPVMTQMEGPITGYDVNYGDRPVPEPPPQPKRRSIDLDDVPYELEGSPHVDPPRGPMPKAWMEPSEYEMRLARGGDTPPPPSSPWMRGVYTFPLDQQILPNLIALACALGLLGVMVQMMHSFASS
jgi:hypothetical protein